MARIAESVRGVVGARAAMVSRVVGEDWLEVMSVVGEPSAGIAEGLRWRRSDLDSVLAGAEQLGRLHATKRRAVSYAEVPDDVPETQRYITAHLGLLLAPLHAPDGALIGVLATEGPVEIANPEPGTCELVELYAEQVRLALGALRDQAVLGERLRMSDAAQGMLHLASGADDVPALLDAVAMGLGEMLRASGSWACIEVEPGVHVEAASYPGDVAESLGYDVYTLLQPVLETCRRDGTTLTQESDALLGRLAAVAGRQQAVLAPVGDGSGARGALLVLRGDDLPGWTSDEQDALFALGVRLGALADRVRDRRRDQETLAELRRLDDYRRDIVMSITHDLKTPLTAITLNADLLESDGRLAEAGSHPVAAIRRSADRLTNLVDDLLAMARAEEGVATRREVDLVEMVREAWAHAEQEAAYRGVHLDLDVPRELMVTVDDHALARVLANLVGNAVKFSLPGGRVGLHLSEAGDAVVFSCTDEGVGIPPDRLANLFDLAHRVPDTRPDERPGSGIALAICRRLIDRMGGEITASSTPGQGSTFTVRLPADPAGVDAAGR